ncbi:MAG: hypothetical protein CMI24_07980 [Opitutae bacterium]|nr:hypothetical protein [Opitutae bacterium]
MCFILIGHYGMFVLEIRVILIVAERGVGRTQPVNLIKFIVVTGTGFVMFNPLLGCLNKLIGTANE